MTCAVDGLECVLCRRRQRVSVSATGAALVVCVGPTDRVGGRIDRSVTIYSPLLYRKPLSSAKRSDAPVFTE